jgi:hypothetical protein
LGQTLRPGAGVGLPFEALGPGIGSDIGLEMKCDDIGI